MNITEDEGVFVSLCTKMLFGFIVLLLLLFHSEHILLLQIVLL